ncbi:MAG: SpaA isopeptide-forming pilin-related protein [Peptococcaceae bacterium]|nr:SpaA isopeptide-forming pilin-related protein [Peptococcaceae bacterium]
MKRRWGQGLLSGLIMLILLIPSFPLTLIAAPLSQIQVVEPGGTRYYDTTGAEVTTGSPVLGSDNVVVSTSKTVEGTDAENEFIVTLDIKTSVDITDVKMSADAAVVLILDISNSMAIPTDYMPALRTAAANFVDDFAQEAGDSSRYISLVTFATTAKIQIGWIDITQPSNLTTVKNLISTLQVDGGTFMQGGLQMARNLLRTDALPNGKNGSPIENRSVILFTDGEATYRNPTTTYDAYTTGASLTQNGGLGNAADPTIETTKQLTVDMAEVVKNSGSFAGLTTPRNKYDAILYTVAFGNESPVTWLKNNIATNSSYAYEASNASQLNSVFAAINKRIESWAQAWIVKDPMGPNIEFLQSISQNDINSGLLKFENNTLEWDLKQASPTSFLNNIYTFSYSYLIRLDTTASTFVPDVPNPVSQDTHLTYIMIVDNKVDGDLYTAALAPASVKGFAGILDFTKVGASNTPLAGCEFTLTNLIQGKPSYTAASAADTGAVHFAGIPSGHTYHLTETALPNGMTDLYHLNHEILTVTVSLGQVTVTNSLGEALDPDFEFVNQKKTIDFIFTKIDGNIYAQHNKKIVVLPGAEFAVFQCTDPGNKHELIPANVINETQTSLSWQPYNLSPTPGHSSNRVTSNADGVVTLSLADGHYMLIETQAPSLNGELYVLPSGQWAIDVSGARAKQIEIIAVPGANGQQPPAFTSDNKLPNLRQQELPLTGGWEIAFISIGGILLVLGITAGVMYYQKRFLAQYRYRS